MLLHVHELHSYVRYYAKDPAFRTAPARYLAVGEAVRAALVNSGVAAQKVVTVHEFVPAARLAAAPPPSPRNAGAPLVVGGAGTVGLRKGVTLWLMMAAEVVRLLGPGAVRFEWIGVPDNHDGWLFREMIDKLGLAEHVTPVATTPYPLRHFVDFDVFAMTSWEDPFPIVSLEAMGVGVPVVCFAQGGGAPEQVGGTGRVVEAFDPAAMGREVAGLLADGDRRRALGQAARQRVLDNFTDGVVVPRIREQVVGLATRMDGAPVSVAGGGLAPEGART